MSGQDTCGTRSPPRQRIPTRASNGRAGTQPKNEFLFQARYGNPLSRDKLHEKVIRPALRDAGLPESFRTYDQRHSHASVHIDLGVNLLALAQRMGPSDPAMTLRLKIDELGAATEPKGGTVVSFGEGEVDGAARLRASERPQPAVGAGGGRRWNLAP